MGRTKRKRLQRRRHLNQTQPTFTSKQVIQLTAYLGGLGWRNETQLIARDFPETGRGLCSKNNIHTGNVLIRLPTEGFITINTLENDEGFKRIFDASRFSQDLAIPSQCLFALYLLYQKRLLSVVHSRERQSYFDYLPQTFSTPYFCAKAELYYLPEDVLEKITAQNREIRSSFINLQKVFKQQNDFHNICLMDAFKWSYFVVNTRCIYAESRNLSGDDKRHKFFYPILSDVPNLALAPFVDLFNHSPDVQTVAEFLPTSNENPKSEFVLTLKEANASLQPRYAQLFINYGSLSNIKLLTEYGFVLSQNKDDFIEFSLLDIENLIKSEKIFRRCSIHRDKFKFIRDHNLSEQMFIHLQDGISHNLVITLHLLLKEPSHYTNILNQVAFGNPSPTNDVDDVLRILISYKIKEYCKFIEGFKTLSELSESGEVMVKYLEQCIRYMKKFLEMYFNL